METIEAWNQAFLRALPVASLGIGVFSTVITVMTVLRYGSLGQKVYSENGRYMVSVRYPGQWIEIREFVTPNDPAVQEVYSQIGPDSWGCLQWVCSQVDYRRDIVEYWQTPSETMRGYGDCEDTSILLTSLLRNFTNAYVALGSFQGYGHAWVAKEGQIYETTYTRARPVPDSEDYCPYCYFNESELIELWPGALDEVFDLQRNEKLKLNLMAEVLADHGL